MVRPALQHLATLAATLPALLALLGALWWAAPEPEDERHAGWVLNGAVVDERVDAAIDRALAREPRILLLGNSNANTDIDVDLLAAGLAVPRARVASLTIPNSSTAHWVAILRRAQRAGLRPDRVLIVSRAQLILVRHPISEGARRSLFSLLTAADADLRRAAMWAPGGTERWRARREGLRDRLGRGLRGWLPDLVVGGPHPGLVVGGPHPGLVVGGPHPGLVVGGPHPGLLGRSTPEAALRRAMADDRIDAALLARPTPPALPDPERSLLPLLVEAAADLETRLTLVRPPSPPLLGPEHGDQVSDAQLAGIRRAVRAGGGELLDLAGLSISRWRYRNPEHLGPEGAATLTGALVAALKPPRGQRVGALGELRADGLIRREVGWAEYRNPPPPPPSPGPVRWSGPRGAVSVADLAWPDDDWTRSATLLRSRCSPLRVAVSGQPLEPGLRCDQVARNPGTSCHQAGEVRFHAEAPGPVAVSLDPERACDGPRWLYPGDEVRIGWPDSPVLAGPLDRLEVDVAAPAEARVVAELRVADRVVARGRVARGGGSVFPLDGLVPDGPLTLWLRNHSRVSVLATRAELVAAP
jgi:hypothetical protein